MKDQQDEKVNNRKSTFCFSPVPTVQRSTVQRPTFTNPTREESDLNLSTQINQVPNVSQQNSTVYHQSNPIIEWSKSQSISITTIQEYKSFKGQYTLEDFNDQHLKNYGILRLRTHPKYNTKGDFVYRHDWVNISDGLVDDDPQRIPLKQTNSLIYIDERGEGSRRVHYIVVIWCFRVRITLRNVIEEAPYVSQYIASGGFGSVVSEVVNGKPCVSKRYYFTNQRSKNSIIKMALRQWALLKLLASHDLGPGLSSIQDEVICYNDCVAFQMVHCESIDQARKSLYYNDQDFYNKLYSDLKEELLGMHSLHVVHRDIKPDNCMYNIQKKRFVLVDFGMSHPVYEDYTDATWAKFIGTQGFISRAMKRIQNSKALQLANLYLSDLQVFEKTITSIKEIKKCVSCRTPCTLTTNDTIEKKLDKLIQRQPGTEKQHEIARLLTKLQDDDKVLDLLRKVSDHNTRRSIIDLLLSQNEVSKTLLPSLQNNKSNLQKYLDDILQKKSLKPVEGEQEFQFQMRIDGCSEETEKLGRKIIAKLQQENQQERIKKLNYYLEDEKKYLIAEDNPLEIRRKCGARISFIQASKAYKSILSRYGKILSQVEHLKILIELIWVEKAFTGKTISTNPILGDLQMSLEKLKRSSSNDTGLNTIRNRQFLQCLIALWKKDPTVLNQIIAFVNNYEKEADICVCVRALYEACKTIDKREHVFKLITIEENIRTKYGLLQCQQAIVMYFCKIQDSPDFATKHESACRGSQILIEPKNVVDFAILDVYVQQLRGYFFMMLHKDKQAQQCFKDVIEYNRLKDVTVSLRLSTTKSYMAQLLTRKGEYTNALTLLPNIFKSKEQVAGELSYQNLQTYYLTCYIYLKKGDYEHAQGICENFLAKLSQMKTDHSLPTHKFHKYQILCLKAQILLEMGEFTEEKYNPITVLKECKVISDELASQHSRMLVRDNHSSLFAIYYSRQRVYDDAHKILKQSRVRVANCKEELAKHIMVELQLLSLQSQFNKSYKNLLSQIDIIYNEIGSDNRLYISSLILRALQLLKKEKQDLGESYCMDIIKKIDPNKDKKSKGHPQLAQAYSILAQIYLLKNEQEKAEKHLAIAKDIFMQQKSWLRKQFESEQRTLESKAKR